jgi:hypothetical protein
LLSPDGPAAFLNSPPLAGVLEGASAFSCFAPVQYTLRRPLLPSVEEAYYEVRFEGALGSQCWSLPRVFLRGPWIAKIFGPAKPLLLRVGDRQPEQQTLVVPQRQCLRLVVYLPVQFPLPPTRGTTACPSIVAQITKVKRCSCRLRLLMSCSPSCQARVGFLRSSYAGGASSSSLGLRPFAL